MKSFAGHTDQKEGFVGQLTTVERRTAHLRDMARNIQPTDDDSDVELDKLPYSAANQRYHISVAQRGGLDIDDWQRDHCDDPVYAVCCFLFDNSMICTR